MSFTQTMKQKRYSSLFQSFNFCFNACFQPSAMASPLMVNCACKNLSINQPTVFLVFFFVLSAYHFVFLLQSHIFYQNIKILIFEIIRYSSRLGLVLMLLLFHILLTPWDGSHRAFKLNWCPIF